MITRDDQYTPVIIQRDGRFCVFLREKNISGEGSTLNEAFTNFEKNISELSFQEERFGLATQAQEPFPNLRGMSIIRELSLFWLKVTTGVALTILLVVLLMPALRAATEHHLSGIFVDIAEIIPTGIYSKKFWAIEIPKRLNNQFDNLTTQEADDLRSEWSFLLTRIDYLLSNNDPDSTTAPSR